MAFNRPMCNCPDATQNQNKNLAAGNSTGLFDRNWNSRISSSGSTIQFPGIRDRGGYCIHELAVLQIRGELTDAFPTGIPYQPRIDGLPNKRKPTQKSESDYLYLSSIPKLEV